MAFPLYKSPSSTQGLRNQIAELTKEVESLKAQLVEAKTKSADGRLLAEIGPLRTTATNYAKLRQLTDEFVAEFEKTHEKNHQEFLADCARLGIKP